MSRRLINPSQVASGILESAAGGITSTAGTIAPHRVDVETLGLVWVKG